MNGIRIAAGCIAALIWMLAGTSSRADGWIGNGSPSSGYTDNEVYVDSVRKFDATADSPKYLAITLMDLYSTTSAWEGCDSLIVSFGENGNTEVDLDAYESLALAAMVETLPIRAYKSSAADSGSCEIRQFYIYNGKQR